MPEGVAVAFMPAFIRICIAPVKAPISRSRLPAYLGRMNDGPSEMKPKPQRTRNPNHDLALRRISQTIWRVRQTLKFTQGQLAERWGISQATLSRWEAGTQMPSGSDLLKIAQEAGIPTSVLTGAEPEAPNQVDSIPVAYVIGGEPCHTRISLPTRFIRPDCVGIEVMDGSASQLYMPGTLLLCEPVTDEAVMPNDICVVTSAADMRIARAMSSEDTRSITWLGLGMTPKWAAPLPASWRPSFRPYGAVSLFSPRVETAGRPSR